MLNAKLKYHLPRPHALSHEIFAYIYIYIDDYSFITSNHWSTWVSKNFVIGHYHMYKMSIDFFIFLFLFLFFLKDIAIVFILIRI